MKIITRLLTKNIAKVPLLWITFNMQKYKKYGKKIPVCAIFTHA